MQNEAVKPAKIERFLVDSSNIKSVGYSDGICVVEFQNGHIYAYAMEHREFEKFALAESKGRYFNTAIRGRFEGVKLTGKCKVCGADPQLIGEPCATCGGLVLAVDKVHKEG